MLWMVRADQTNRMTKFLDDNIIAVHWGIGDLTGCSTKKDVENVVAQANLKPRDASLKVGLLNCFVNQMKIDDHCIVPYNDVFYIAIIKSDYYFDPNSQKFEHQRRVEWLFNGEPFSRYELPATMYTTTNSRLGLLDMTKHKSIFIEYLNHEHGIEINKLSDESNSLSSLESELNSMVIDAVKIIKDEINSDDPNRRLKAAIAVIELNNK